VYALTWEKDGRTGTEADDKFEAFMGRVEELKAIGARVWAWSMLGGDRYSEG
jgi:hypothetical protein